MAQSTNYFGLRRGSTKSLTFSVVDGKQITKDRVEGGKNPRTPAQMSQRCLLYTACTAYSAMKSICDHSFEEITAGSQCMYTFRKENMKQLRLCKESGNGFFGFSKYRDSGLVPGSYIISKGSLPVSCPDASILSINVANKQISINVTAGISIADITDDMGCKNFGDTCTIALMYPKANGYYGFGAICFTYKQAETILESFTVEVFGDVANATPTFDSSGLTLSVRMKTELAANATADNTYLAAIASRQVNGNWHRSKAQFDVQNATPTFEQAIATYPIGERRILNGSGADVAAPVNPVVTVAAPTINGTTPFTETTSVTMSGPSGAEIRYTTDGSTPTASSSLYSTAITLSSTTTVKAIAIKDGQSSSVTSKTFTKSSGGGGDDDGGDAN